MKTLEQYLVDHLADYPTMRAKIMEHVTAREAAERERVKAEIYRSLSTDLALDVIADVYPPTAPQPPAEPTPVAPQQAGNPYARTITSCLPADTTTAIVDVYSIGKAFPMANAVFHAVKKCLLAGERRGDKGYETDLREAVESLLREIDDVAKGGA